MRKLGARKRRRASALRPIDYDRRKAHVCAPRRKGKSGRRERESPSSVEAPGAATPPASVFDVWLAVGPGERLRRSAAAVAFGGLSFALISFVTYWLIYRLGFLLVVPCIYASFCVLAALAFWPARLQSRALQYFALAVLAAVIFVVFQVLVSQYFFDYMGAILPLFCVVSLAIVVEAAGFLIAVGVGMVSAIAFMGLQVVGITSAPPLFALTLFLYFAIVGAVAAKGWLSTLQRLALVAFVVGLSFTLAGWLVWGVNVAAALPAMIAAIVSAVATAALVKLSRENVGKRQSTGH
jgi:hypothetical protein